MSDPAEQARRLEQIFTRILHEQMAGIPILNDHIQVQVVGFQAYQDRIIGILITPWMMNLMMFPGDQDNWDELEIGHKRPHEFPGGEYRFTINEIEGLGKCQTHSLYSPMRQFKSQAQALTAAGSFLDTLMTEAEAPNQETPDEELLGRILRGEDTPPVHLDEFATIEPVGSPQSATPSLTKIAENPISRRDLLRGRFRKTH